MQNVKLTTDTKVTKVTMISHASVLIEHGSVAVLADPWFMGEVFNESWSLLCPSALNPDGLDSVSHIWISHEHPDHLHFPTLKAIPAEHKSRITLLYQQHFSPRVVKALHGLGFRAVQELPLLKWYPLGDDVAVQCGSVGTVDSWLATRTGDVTVLNVNDCIVTPSIARHIASRLGRIDTLLIQFSIANWAGNPEETRVTRSKEVVDRIRMCIEILRPKVTIPFASFVYFSHTENRHMNAWVNTPDSVVHALADSPTQLAFLYNGDSWSRQAGVRTDGDPLERYRTAFAAIDTRSFRSHPHVPVEELLTLGRQLITQVQTRFPNRLLRRAAPLLFYIEDLHQAISFDLSGGRIESVPRQRQACDMALGSQALEFALRFPWGFSTLEVSGRYTLLNPDSNRLALYLCHLAAADIDAGHLWQRLFDARTWRFCWSKRQELFGRFHTYMQTRQPLRKGVPLAGPISPLSRS